MDEQRFWSSALGEWICDCVCGTFSPSSKNSDPNLCGPIISESTWRSPANFDLQLRYSELCDSIALNLLFCFLSSANDQQQSSAFLLFPSFSTTYKNSFLPIEDQQLHNCDRQRHFTVERSESLSSGFSSENNNNNNVICAGSCQSIVKRLRQFQQLLRALCLFYQSNSLLIITLPKIHCIARSPSSEISGHEMQKLLALLLGAAVQSPQRERFIERIKHMRPEIQSELVEEIQRVTNSANTNSPVVNLDSLLAELEQQPSTGEEAIDRAEEGIENNNQRVVALLERVIRERDEYTNELFEMAADMEQEGSSGSSSSGMATASSSCNGDISVPNNAKCISSGARSPSPNALDRHLSVELAAAKGELRKLRNENDEKDEILQEMQDELLQQRIEIGRLQAERLELVKDARAAKDYRDEMDCMQHKLNRLERLEAENEKLRSRLNELDFYKNRVNHLKEDNKIMHETNQVMEEQLEQYQKKISSHLEVETKLIEAQGNVKSLQLDMTKTRERIEELLLENGRLERELHVNRQKCSELERQICSLTEFDSPRIELDNGSNTSLFNESSLLAQLEAHNQSQILELQLDNKKLKAQLESKERNSKSANPAELFEIRKELAEKEKILTEKEEFIKNLFIKLELANKKAEENSERFRKEQQNVEQLERQLVEFKRTSVPLKIHQTLMEQLERVEQKKQELERNLIMEKEQYELIKDEKLEIENQLQKMCTQQRDIRAELDSLKEKHQTEIIQWEKQKKSFEAEKSALKIRLELLEAKEQALTVAEQNAENLTRKLGDLQKDLTEAEAKREFSVEELVKEKQQLNAEIRKGQRFREELATERGRLRDLLARLRSVCLMAINSSDNCCLEPDCLDDDMQLISVIDDLLMKALSSARREADSLRIQQQKQIRELDDLKRDIQSLRRTGHELNASDDKLLMENRNIKEQVILLQERLQKAHADECTRAAELLAAKREIEELQQKSFITSRQTAELASLQIAIKNKDKQEEQHKQELAAVRLQAETALKANTESLKRLESLELIHSALASDHDRLQNLHQMLSSDYDRVITLQKKLKGEKSLNEQTLKADFLRERSNLELELEQERTERQREVRKMYELEIELDRVNRELKELKRDQNSIAHRSDNCLDELRRLRISECAQKSTICNLNVIIQQLNNALTEKDLELANLRRQVEMLRQYTGDENRTLIRQIELLLVQNQQLHNRSDAFYNEQKELQEKLQHLRRHKEKLEEKIMEQYKAMDSRKLERPTFMKRAAKALISKSPSRKGRVGKDGNSASDKSEESSIYSTENELLNAGGHRTPTVGSPPPPPPCPGPTTISEHSNGIVNGNGTAYSFNHSQIASNGHQNKQNHHQQQQQLPHHHSHYQSPANSPLLAQNFPHSRAASTATACSSSLYSSISSNFYNQQQNIDRPRIIEQSLHLANANNGSNFNSPIMLMRARNGRIGGSLRYPPSSTPPMARSFPAPPWRNSSVNGRKQEEFVKPANQCDSTKLPACYKVMQADVLPEEEDRVINRITKHGNLPNHQNNQIQQPRIISQSSSIATTSLSPKRAPLLSTQINQQQFINRPPPPPYPGQNVSKNSGGQTNNKVYGNFRVNGIGQTNNLNKNNPNKVTYPPNIHSNDDINNLIPCDTSTPKSVADSPNSSIKKFHYQQPPTQNNNIPSEFSRANNVNGLKKDLSPSTPQPSRNELRLDTKKPLIVPAQTFNKDSQKITENLNIERPERVPSIYENVSKNGENTEINVKEIKEDKNNKTIEKPSSDVGERRGEKGAIWYELGCV